MSRLLFPLLMFCATACVEEVGLFDGEDARRLIVIDAAVSTADSLQYVYISHGGEWSEPDEVFRDAIYDIVDTRLVTLTDDLGRGDTFDVSPNGRICTLARPDLSPGRTYRLDVLVGNRHFYAVQAMRPHPIAEGIRFVRRLTKDDEIYTPVFYFRDAEPDVVNYYLFSPRFSVMAREGAVHQYPPIMLLSDARLYEVVDGVELSNGLGGGGDDRGYWGEINFASRGFYSYALSSVSREVYDYYAALERQITSDGGVYQTAPATPRTNFVGDNVQGLFVAADTYEFRGPISFPMQ